MTKKELEDLDKLAEWMDNRFVIPGTSIRFGMDSLLGLIPGLGDTATALISLHLVGKAQKYKLPVTSSHRCTKMPSSTGQ